MSQTGTFYGVGVGPGNPDLLTLQAVKVLTSVDVVYEAQSKTSEESVSGRIINSLEDCKAEREALIFSMSLDQEIRSQAHRDAAAIVAAQLKAGKDCAFATIGDPMVYSTYIYLLREVQKLIPDVPVVTVPGITSFQAAASKANFPLVEDTNNLVIVPAFDKENFSSSHLPETADSIVMLKTYKTRDEVPDFLEQEGYSLTGVYGSKIGSDEEIITTDLNSIKDLPQEYLSLVIAKKKDA